MKAKIMSLFSLLALLLVSTTILADGRPTGIRIGRLVSGGNMNVELDVTVTGTNRSYSPFNSPYVQVIGNTVWGIGRSAWQYTSSFSDPVPFAVDWGDGSYIGSTPLFGGGPWTGTFAHTYSVPGTYLVTVGDAYGTDGIVGIPKGIVPYTGNAVTGSTRFVWTGSNGYPSFINYFSTWTTNSPGLLLAITANGTVTTGTGIPALNIYGLLALSLVLVGAGLLVFRRPQRSAL